jgi:hypothetical protein
MVLKYLKKIVKFEITTKKSIYADLSLVLPVVGISSGQRDLMKTYHNEANTGGITKIVSKNILEFFGQSR